MGAAAISAREGDDKKNDASDGEHDPNREIRALDAASTDGASVGVAWCYRRRRGRLRRGGRKRRRRCHACVARAEAKRAYRAVLSCRDHQLPCTAAPRSFDGARLVYQVLPVSARAIAELVRIVPSGEFHGSVVDAAHGAHLMPGRR